MIVKSILTKDMKPTSEQIAEVRRAASIPIVFDEDCPELTSEELSEFKRVYPHIEERAQ